MKGGGRPLPDPLLDDRELRNAPESGIQNLATYGWNL